MPSRVVALGFAVLTLLHVAVPLKAPMVSCDVDHGKSVGAAKFGGIEPGIYNIINSATGPAPQLHRIYSPIR
ncbi:hypothetical protein FB451DRAFT_1398462 [Mycena latifolia]|nr:hypothetical protein FB451DRAFT_1398462 [Mycena latifolia]